MSVGFGKWQSDRVALKFPPEGDVVLHCCDYKRIIMSDLCFKIRDMSYLSLEKHSQHLSNF